MPKICKHEYCTNFVFSGGFCNFHQYLRTDKKPSSKKVEKVRQQIRKVSTKQAAKNQEYSKLRDDFMSHNPLCKANLSGCTKIATDLHHKKGRVTYLLDVTTYIALCRNCHQKIEENPTMAKEKGFSDSRLND